MENRHTTANSKEIIFFLILKPPFFFLLMTYPFFMSDYTTF